jgi:hypothetical protein
VRAIKPALIERLNATLPVPYALSSLVIAVLLGPLGFYFAYLLEYLDVPRGTTAFLNTSLGHNTLSQLVGNNVIYPGIIFYCAFMLRYMRLRITRVEEELVAESPEWADTTRRSFARISQTGPAVGITLLIFLASLPLLEYQVSSNQGFPRFYFGITYPLFLFGAGSFIWMYVSSLWGLYRIGTEPIKLKPHTEDALLGLGGFGRISLTLTTVFLIAVFLAVYEFTAFATAMPILLTILFSASLITLGICMFFLPLMNIHKRMISERDQLRNQNLGAIISVVSEDNTWEDRSQVHSLRKILVLEHEADQIKGIPSWPFDTAMIRILAGVVFGIVISLSAHLIIVYLSI